MTPRERWLAVVQGELPDRVPMYYRATGEATDKLMAHLGCHTMSELLERLHVDSVAHVGPRYAGPSPPPGQDMFGRRFRAVAYEGGTYTECVHHPLAGLDSVRASKGRTPGRSRTGMITAICRIRWKEPKTAYSPVAAPNRS